jgi:Type II secretion system (T2SS), protein G
MSLMSYIFSHPVEASRTFWRAITGTETLAERSKDEQARLNMLRMAISLYHMKFGRLPETLQDLCHNNHNDSGWSDPFIRWRGEDTFHDTFGFPYRYAVTDGRYELVSPGLETATKCVT